MPTRDTYGGLPGSGAKFGLKKTGFFHIQKIHDAKRGALPVLVDPEGNLWFQLGLCALGAAAILSPGADRVSRSTGCRPHRASSPTASYRWRRRRFRFTSPIGRARYGQPWNPEDFTAQTIDRVRKLGFNSSGAFSAWTKIEQERNFPRVGWVDFSGIDTIPDTHDIMDPFATGAAEKLDKNCAAICGRQPGPARHRPFSGQRTAV